jgi:2-oxoisovalerate dehydrogenase E2 component (dihydrolipoyl transacylase)
MTVPDFRLPDLGEGLEEAEVIAWRVKPGDHVAVDQVIAEVETAKAVVEVPVPTRASSPPCTPSPAASSPSGSR